MDSPPIAPFLVARDAYRRWLKLRDACLRMVQERLPRAKLRTALLRCITTQALTDARLQADAAACALANVHGDQVFASAGIWAPTDCFYGQSLRAPGNARAGPATQSRGNEMGLPEVLGFIDLDGAAFAFLQSVRDLPGVPSRRVVDACEKRFKAEYGRAMDCLKRQRLEGEASHACAVYFRQALPDDVGQRVLELAY